MSRVLQMLFLALFVSLAAALVAAGMARAQSLPANPGTFGAMTCQQFWYAEQQVLAEGGVCLKSERARRAFQRAGRCISSDEDILTAKARGYLAELRAAARRKHCSGF